MTTAGSVDIDERALHWGAAGSDFTTWRRGILQNGAGETWLRESGSHAALFTGTPVAGASPTPSVVAQYLNGTACATSAKNAADSDAVVGESLAASTFACGGLDDLAVALDGLAPRTAVVTRWSGLVARGQLGIDRAIAFDPNAAQMVPAVRSGSYEACIEPSGSSPNRPLAPGPTGGTTDEGYVVDNTDVVYVGDGCGGGTTTTTTYEDDDTTVASSSDDGCGGDTSTTSTSSDDGWDSSDDASDSCDSDTSSSSSSSDSCSGSSSGGSSSGGSGGSDDGWDTEDEMSPKAKKTSLKVSPKRKSPFSRYALFAVALILPLRRRARAALERR
jgi:hypothetical protein